MIYVVNIEDIEQALLKLGGEAKAKDIQDHIFEVHCNNQIPENYQHDKSFRQTIQRKIEDYCPQAAGFDPSKKEGKFLRVSYGLYHIATGHKGKEFPAIEEVPNSENFIEGATTRVSVNYYERNAEARKICISNYGCKCFVCGFDFKKTYGDIGKSYIHVHHVIPLSEIKASYVVNPIKDLRPVCANCHGVIHRTQRALTIDEIKSALIEAAS